MKKKRIPKGIALFFLVSMLFVGEKTGKAQEARSVETESTIVFYGRYPYPSEPTTPTPPSGPQEDPGMVARPPSTGKIPQLNQTIVTWGRWLGGILVLLAGIIFYKRKKQKENNSEIKRGT